jgi:nitrate reductase cytochrome c-type subunit
MTKIISALLLIILLAFASAKDATAEESQRLPRSYPGAPPLIPHDVEARKGLCLTCHETGVAGAPVVPHPTRDPLCLECHVGQDRTVKEFRSGAKPVKQ